VRNTTGFYPRVQVDTGGTGVVSHAGGLLLTETVRTIGPGRLLSTALERWHKPLATITRARSCVIWRSAWPSVGTAWPTSAYFAPQPASTARWPPIRRSPAQLTRWPRMRRRRWRRSTPRVLRRGPGSGR
jgi:hypothetical protein